MRYLFGFMCVCALGVVPLVGCGENGNGPGGSGGTAATGGGGSGGTAATGGGGSRGTDLCEGVDCDDGNECTDDTCVDSTCSHTAVEDDTSCGDGAGTCHAGSCSGTFACTEAGIGEAIAVGGGPHTFDCGGPKTVTTDAEIGIDRDVILDGEGNLTVDGGGEHADALDDHRIFSVAEGVTAELRALTVSGGASTGDILAGEGFGGGIHNDRGGILTLTNSTVSGNTAIVAGGGIYNLGWLTLTNSTVSGNTAIVAGGGILTFGTLTLTNSTVSGNAATQGGGGIANSGTLTLMDSTVSENTSQFGGGGIAVFAGTATLTNSTVSGNDGFGVASEGVATLINSTISGNSEGSLAVECSFAFTIECGRFDLINSTMSGDTACLSSTGFECDEPQAFNVSTLTNTVIDGVCGELWVATSNGYNIESPGNTCGFDQLTDQASVTEMQLNLGPLADNGGPTQTHALGPGSFAIDQIPVTECVDVDSMPLTEDQRGVTRPQGPACDVGAFELEVGP
ncbi:MAG: hypothetical protein OES69_02450 [Myxococcales bacterium]|nr:hypothetical protein [Myxococcales bacterium]MDH3842773.1 hypothetical protein [Myxococcales bacterium]